MEVQSVAGAMETAMEGVVAEAMQGRRAASGDQRRGSGGTCEAQRLRQTRSSVRLSLSCPAEGRESAASPFVTLRPTKARLSLSLFLCLQRRIPLAARSTTPLHRNRHASEETSSSSSGRCSA